MRRLWAAGIIVVVMLAYCVISIFAVTHQEQDMINLLERAYEAANAGDFEKAYELARQSEERWVEVEGAIFMFISHLELAEIGASISRMPPLIKNENSAEFMAVSRYVIVRITHLAQSERVSIQNVL